MVIETVYPLLKLKLISFFPLTLLSTLWLIQCFGLERTLGLILSSHMDLKRREQIRRGMLSLIFGTKISTENRYSCTIFLVSSFRLYCLYPESQASPFPTFLSVIVPYHLILDNSSALLLSWLNSVKLNAKEY